MVSPLYHRCSRKLRSHVDQICPACNQVQESDFFPSVHWRLTESRENNPELQHVENLTFYVLNEKPGPIPDSMHICSKFDFFLILSCYGKLDVTNLQRNSSCGKINLN
ncbi:hypothetical protein AVEN_275077-1 [Araneus ventricosus]|uniref:Uncharacterized protein n=1 Tax=Araneus ventricosus TaxID=182803 RepID=A0A4Y2NN07_ARAVE|nr:hypothetical protein AVEN_275077-1 [Araneus ventricosus]